MTEPFPPPPATAAVRAARARVDELRRQLADAERALQQLLEAAGCRSDDGSAQPGLFTPSPQPRLW
jgi:hypothetical protein